MLSRVCCTLSLALLLCGAARAQGRALLLVPTGAPRQLPLRVLGASSEPFWRTDHLLDDRAHMEAVQSLHLAYLRFPGGSQSNYYDWKRGFSL